MQQITLSTPSPVHTPPPGFTSLENDILSILQGRRQGKDALDALQLAQQQAFAHGSRQFLSEDVLKQLAIAVIQTRNPRRTETFVRNAMQTVCNGLKGLHGRDRTDMWRRLAEGGFPELAGAFA